jgi:ankyrin repeat protein
MKARLGIVPAILGCLLAAAPAIAQSGAKLAVGPDAGGYLCPDGRQLYVKSCYDDSPNANCGIVLMHLPLQRGYQQERTQIRSEITPGIAACKVYPLEFRNDGTVQLALPKSAQQTAKAPVAALAPISSASIAPKSVATPAAPAAQSPAKAPPVVVRTRLPETEIEKKFFDAIKRNFFQLAVNTLISAPKDKPIPIAELADEQGMTVLHWSAANKSAAGMRWLLDKKLPVNLADKKGRTPLKIALDNKDTNTMAVLLNAGADVKLAWPGYDGPLQGRKSNTEFAEFLIAAAAAK